MFDEVGIEGWGASATNGNGTSLGFVRHGMGGTVDVSARDVAEDIGLVQIKTQTALVAVVDEGLDRLRSFEKSGRKGGQCVLLLG